MSDGQAERHRRIAVINEDTQYLSSMEKVLTEAAHDVDVMRIFSLAQDRVRAAFPDRVVPKLRALEGRDLLEPRGIIAIADALARQGGVRHM